MKSVKILIADDHELIREGLKSRLERQAGWRVCGEVENGRQAVEMAIKLKPDIVVMDIGMAELNGIEAARQIRRECPDIEVLMLTLQESEDLVRESLAAGARGFIFKTDAARLMVLAIQELLQHKTFFTTKVSNIVLQGFLDPDRAVTQRQEARGRLSMRELEILQLLAEARTSKEIATRLGVSVKTVEAHRSNLMRKLDLHSVAELVRYAVRNKIIDP